MGISDGGDDCAGGDLQVPDVLHAHQARAHQSVSNGLGHSILPRETQACPGEGIPETRRRGKGESPRPGDSGQGERAVLQPGQDMAGEEVGLGGVRIA